MCSLKCSLILDKRGTGCLWLSLHRVNWLLIYQVVGEFSDPAVITIKYDVFKLLLLSSLTHELLINALGCR